MSEPVKRGRENRDTWAKRVERWKDSGLTSGEFCAETDLNPRTLMYWAWRLRKEARPPIKEPERQGKSPRVAPPTAGRKQRREKEGGRVPKFVELVATPSPGSHDPIEIVVRSVVVRVPQTAAADLVRRAFEFAEKQK